MPPIVIIMAALLLPVPLPCQVQLVFQLRTEGKSGIITIANNSLAPRLPPLFVLQATKAGVKVWEQG